MLHFAKLGQQLTEHGVHLYGRAPHVGKQAFSHTLYPLLSDLQIASLGASIGRQIPAHLADFYRECNGLHYFVDTLSIDGLRLVGGRGFDAFYQPYGLATPNVDERIHGAADDMVFFNGYAWDGSRVYTKTDDRRVFLCPWHTVQPLKIWPSLQDFITGESARIFERFDAKGVLLDESRSTLPV